MDRTTLSVDTLNVRRLLDAADSFSIQRGRNYFQHGRARLNRLDRSEAEYAVNGSRPEPYHVRIGLNDGGEIVATCDCPFAHGVPKVICKHKIAAAMALQDHLRFNPPLSWEQILDDTLGSKKKASASGGAKVALIFSLQKRTNTWGVFAYTLPATQFREGEYGPEQLAKEIKVRGLSDSGKEVKSPIDARRIVNGSAETRVASQMAVMAQQYYYFYYYSRSTVVGTLLPLLAGEDSLVYQGTERKPFQTRIQILKEKAQPALTMEETGEGLRVRFTLTVDDRDFTFEKGKLQVISEEPMWALADGKLFEVEGASEAFGAFMENPVLDIPAEASSFFLDRYLLPLAERIPIRGEAIQWEDVEEKPVPRVYLGEADETMRAELKFAYGGHELAYDRTLPEQSVMRKEDSLTLVKIQRDPIAEQAAWEALNGYGLKRGKEAGEFLLRARTHPVDFLFKEVPRLTAAGYEVYGEEALLGARVNRNRPVLNLRVSSGIDWFDVQAVVSFGEMEVSLKDVRRAVRRKEKYIKLTDGSIGQIPEDWLDRYRHLFALGEETDEGIRLDHHHLTLVDALLEEADESQTDEEFRRRRERLTDFKKITPKDLPVGFQGELRPYQKHGYDWLHFLHEFEFGGCLADDMGIGKTIQALVFLLSQKKSGHAEKASLIVMPRSLLFNWEREVQKFTPELKVYVHAEGDRNKDVSVFDEYDLILTTYGIMLRDIELLRQYRFHYALLDESQAIKNPLSLTSKAARLLQCDHRLALTGTPIENSTMELWSQFAFLNPGLLGNLEYFREEFGNAIERQGDESSAQLLRRLVYPFILRRTKDQVAPELPPRTERILYTEMEPAQRKLYDKWRDYYRAMLLGMIENEGMNNARMKILEGLLRLRQICNHPKLVEKDYKGEAGKFEQLMETLETLRSEGHKALVFSQFVQMLKIVREGLDRQETPYVYLDGQTKDRQEKVDTFQQSEGIPFFLISLKAGGVGLNLTAADYVIHIDPWWNPAVEMQATDRTHRIGQDKPVFVYKLIVKDSVEEKILQLQDRKRQLVSQIITTESGFFKSLTAEDVKSLFE